MECRMITVLLLTLCSIVIRSFSEDEIFDVRKHLSTVSRYGVVKDIPDNAFVPSQIPDGCTPIHLNLVARHGTRSPTKKRIKELDNLAARLHILLQDKEGSADKVPAWLRGWESPWKGRLKGGELTSKGEVELYQLAIRIRERFPNLFHEDYHPDIYVIKATQVPRASASAVAFGMGLFNERGALGSGRHRAFAVGSESRGSDIVLRFHENCQNYNDYRRKQEPAVNKLKEPILDDITSALHSRYGLNFSRQDASSLWFLCKQEASLLDITDQACQLFSQSESENKRHNPRQNEAVTSGLEAYVNLLSIIFPPTTIFGFGIKGEETVLISSLPIALLEWADDLEVFVLKGYGKTVNYRMGIPLLEDVLQSMEQAIKAKEEGFPSGSYEKARLRFAHAETVIPFSCLLGLFIEGSEFEQIQKEQPMQLPPKPPSKRNWRGSTVAPFGGNNMLVLYSCPVKTSSEYYIQVLHNEHPIPMPGCGNSDFCPFEVFKERVVSPHSKHSYDAVCKLNVEKLEKKAATSKLSQLFGWLFSHGYDVSEHVNSEL